MFPQNKSISLRVQLLQKLILSVFIGFTGYFLISNNVINLSVVSNSYWLKFMYLLVAVGLYLNVSEIDLKDISLNWKTLASILLFGLPIKIFLPGVCLGLFDRELWSIVFLASTVIAQIDPIAASYNLKFTNLNSRTKTILRFWSSFDDPITVLFAFYIFLPFTLTRSSFHIIHYITSLCIELIISIIIYFLYQKFKYKIRNFKNNMINMLDLFFISIIVLISGFSGSFLVPAIVGIIIRPYIPPKISEYILGFIFYFSIFTTGALTASLGFRNLNWTAGLILGGLMFFVAQPIVTLIFVRKLENRERSRIMFGHENGMTAILLTVAIELSNQELNILAITLPAIFFISIMYIVVNGYLDNLFIH